MTNVELMLLKKPPLKWRNELELSLIELDMVGGGGIGSLLL